MPRVPQSSPVAQERGWQVVVCAPVQAQLSVQNPVKSQLLLQLSTWQCVVQVSNDDAQPLLARQPQSHDLDAHWPSEPHRLS
jgi:hypothetical protein